MTDIRVSEAEIYKIDGNQITRWRERGSTPNDVALEIIRERLDSRDRSLARWRRAWFWVSILVWAVGIALVVTRPWSLMP